jgi:hypothetical protein
MMKIKRRADLAKSVILASGVFFLVACGGGGGATSNTPTTGTTDTTATDTTATDTTATDTTSTGLRFGISGSSAIIANKEAIQEVTTAARSSITGDTLFTYRIADGLNSSNELRNRHDGNAVHGITNLIAVDASGQASIAMDADDPILVKYSAVNPDGTKLYIALEPWATDTNDYTKFITKTNCAIWEVDIVDDTNFRCVEEGLFAQSIDDGYSQAVNNNSKPIQFDSSGNVYLLATGFTVTSNPGWCDSSAVSTFTNDDSQTYDESSQVNGCTQEALDLGYVYISDNFIDYTMWSPILYKHVLASKTTTALTTDAESINYFSVLSSGDVVAKGWSNIGSDQTFDIIKPDKSRIDLVGNGWGVDFFAVDNDKTVLFSSWDSTGGLRLVTPVGGGVQKTTLDLNQFANVNNGVYANPTPRKIIVADDGNLYGVFEGNSGYSDSNGSYVYNSTLTVYQILPYDPVPKAILELGDTGWWDFMDGTPFQISKGHLFYKNVAEPLAFDGISFGTYDSISMVNLQSLKSKTILVPTTDSDPKYKIYNWRLSGTKLYFSAVDRSSASLVVTGIIDTVALRTAGVDGTETDYLTIQETASALGAAAEVSDISVIQATRPENDPGGTPKAEYFLNKENLSSASIEFTKYMDQDGVLAGLSFKNDDDTTDIGYIPLWINKSLHLVPDTGSLSDNIGTGLSNGVKYSLTLASTVNDFYDTEIDISTLKSGSVLTLPSSGWYAGNTDITDTNLSSGTVAKFAGSGMANYTNSYYKLVSDLPANFSFEFSAKNLQYTQVGFSINQTDGNADHWEGQVVDHTIDSYSSMMDYMNTTSDNTYISFNNDNADGAKVTANGNWVKYKLVVIGNRYTFSSSTDGLTFVELNSVLDIKSSSLAELYLRVAERAYIDDIVVTTLDGSGNRASVTGDLYNESTFSIPLRAELLTPAPSGPGNGIGW